MLGKIPQVQLKDQDAMRSQSNILDVVNQLVDIPFLKGVKVTASLAVGDNIINHKLSRSPVGWIVTDQSSTSSLYRAGWDNLTITINSSAATSVDLWVF